MKPMHVASILKPINEGEILDEALSPASSSPALSPLRVRPSSDHFPVSDSLSLGPLSPAQHVPGLGISEGSSLIPQMQAAEPASPSEP